MNLSKLKSLEKCCLDSVAKDLDRFNTVYLTTKDNLLKMNLLFMQREYAHELLNIVKNNTSNTLERKYFKLLINESLKELSTHMFHANDLEHAMERVVEIAPALQNITFRFQEVDTYSLHPKTFTHAVIPHLRNIKALMLHRLPYCVDSTLKLISCHCPTLKELIISNCLATNEGIKNLCPSGGSQGLTLTSFELSGIYNLDEGVYHLFRNMPSLQKIDYFNFPLLLIPLHEKDLYNNTLHLLPKCNLTSLSVINIHSSGPEVNISLLILAEMCPHLSELTVILTQDNVFREIEKFPKLTYLEVIYMTFNKNEFLNVNQLIMSVGKKLNHLKLQNCEFSPSVLIRCCPNLEELILFWSRIQPPNDEGKDLYFNKLKKLEFKCYNFRKMSVDIVLSCDILKYCSLLEKLTLSEFYLQSTSMFPDILLNFCTKTKTLKELFIMDFKIQPSFLQAIVLSCEPLKKLSVIFCCDIGESYFNKLGTILSGNEKKLEFSCENKVLCPHRYDGYYFD